MSICSIADAGFVREYDLRMMTNTIRANAATYTDGIFADLVTFIGDSRNCVCNAFSQLLVCANLVSIVSLLVHCLSMLEPTPMPTPAPTPIPTPGKSDTCFHCFICSMTSCNLAPTPVPTPQPTPGSFYRLFCLNQLS